MTESPAQPRSSTSAWVFGAHNLKAGYGIEKTVNDVNRFYPGGYVLIWWDRSFAGVSGVPDRGTWLLRSE